MSGSDLFSGRCALAFVWLTLVALPSVDALAAPTGAAITAKVGDARVTFSPRDGTPLSWQILEQGGGQLDLVDRSLLDEPGPRPLQVDLPGVDMTAGTFALTTGTWRGHEALIGSRVIGPVTVLTVMSLDEDVAHTLHCEIRNDGSKPLVIAEDGRGPGLTWGAGLGASPARSGITEELRSYVEPFWQDDEGLRSIELDPESTSKARGKALAVVGLHRHYFAMAAWPADGKRWAGATARHDPRAAGLDAASRRFYPALHAYMAPLTVAPGASASFAFRVYVGPKDAPRLAAAFPGLDGLVYEHLWGWTAALCRALEALLGLVHGVVGNWGAAIVALAIALRIVMWPISRFGIRHQRASQARLKEFNTRSAAIKKEFAAQPDVRDRKVVELYDQIGIGPVGQLKGCLPMLLQIPILVGLYHVLSATWALRAVPFLWIDDLTLADRLFSWGVTLPWLGQHFNLLPVLMFVVQIYGALALEPPAGKEKSKPALGLLVAPLLMLFVFYPFPAGCMLYWTIANAGQAFETALVRWRRPNIEVP